MDNSFTDAELRMCQDFIVKLAMEAGRMIHAGFSVERKSYAEKSSPNDLVTETDAAVEKFLISAICEKFPSHRFIGEESAQGSTTLTDEPTWMIDPIDGTMNFIHSNPHICVSIGLVASKTPILGVIYNPILNELYTARFGAGAYMNGRPIRVSQTTEMSRSLMMTEFGTSVDHLTQKHVMLGKVLHKLHGVRATGSAALNMAYIARGSADIMTEFGLHCWDMAAGAVIVREAGGCVLDATAGDLDLMSRRVLAASCLPLAHEVSSLLDSHTFNFPRD